MISSEMTSPTDQGTSRLRVGAPTKPRNWSTLGMLRRMDPAAWERKIRDAMAAAEGDVHVAAKALDVSSRQLFRLLKDPTFVDVDRQPVGNPLLVGKRPQ